MPILITNAIADAIADAKTDLTAELQKWVSGRLTSVTLIPDLYENGIETIEVNSLRYKKMKVNSGQVFMNGKEVKLNTVQEAIDNKLAYVTEDRKGNGLILSKSIKMNTSLANMKGVSNGKVIDADKEYAVAEDYRKKLKTKCPSVEQNVGNLSGGLPFLHIKAGGSVCTPSYFTLENLMHYIYQEGRTVFKYAVANMANCKIS